MLDFITVIKLRKKSVWLYFKIFRRRIHLNTYRIFQPATKLIFINLRKNERGLYFFNSLFIIIKFKCRLKVWLSFKTLPLLSFIQNYSFYPLKWGKVKWDTLARSLYLFIPKYIHFKKLRNDNKNSTFKKNYFCIIFFKF